MSTEFSPTPAPVPPPASSPPPSRRRRRGPRARWLLFTHLRGGPVTNSPGGLVCDGFAGRACQQLAAGH